MGRIRRSLSRVRIALQWRRVHLVRMMNGWLARKDAATRIALRWPWPLRKPWQKRQIRLYSYGGGIGDEVMCTPVFRAIKQANPECRITFLSRYPQVFRGQPNLDAVELLKKGEQPVGHALTYGPSTPPLRPLVTMLGECIGLQVPPSDLERLVLPAPDSEILRRLAQIRRSRVVVQPLASNWAENKQWAREQWLDLIQQLVREYEVIEVGTESIAGEGNFGPRFHRFAGQTDILGFAHIIAAADVFVGPVSGGMHLANALRIPSVIIFGGYEAPSGHHYSRMTSLYSPVSCAPCWLPAGCPNARQCLQMISPGQVMDAVRTHMQRPATA